MNWRRVILLMVLTWGGFLALVWASNSGVFP
jgi:hypothetical protein